MLCQGEELRPFIEGAIGAPIGSPAFFIGSVDPDGVKCVAAVSNWSGEDCEISIASAGALSRGLLRRLAAYVYDELGCSRCSTRTPATHPAEWHDALGRIGFVEEGRMRKALNGADVVIYGMLKQECRFYGKQVAKSPGIADGAGTSAAD